MKCNWSNYGIMDCSIQGLTSHYHQHMVSPSQEIEMQLLHLQLIRRRRPESAPEARRGKFAKPTVCRGKTNVSRLRKPSQTPSLFSTSVFVLDIPAFIDLT